MEFEKIKELIESVSQSNLTRFELQDENLKISMYTDREQRLAVAPKVSAAMPLVSPMGEGVEGVDIRQQEARGQVVKSPLVGTFYSAPGEGEEPYVRIGDPVEKGQVLGIIEAMKLMNEIESDYRGKIREILVENGQMVEYGQPLFVVE